MGGGSPHGVPPPAPPSDGGGSHGTTLRVQQSCLVILFRPKLIKIGIATGARDPLQKAEAEIATQQEARFSTPSPSPNPRQWPANSTSRCSLGHGHGPLRML